jgi:predicted Fe-Mo cluster-binding NifX family protein
MTGSTIIGLIVGVVLVAIVLILIIFLKAGEKQIPMKETTKPRSTNGSVHVKHDDLTAIEGIGPKISGMLKENGITTYKVLAKTDASKIANLLKKGGFTLAEPSTWPQQAALLAEGKMKELKMLQANLKGGRRV